MANYSILKAAVEAVVKTNGNEEITGANLQSTLLSIIESLGADYQFAGVATPSTSPGTPDQNVFYVGGAGTYENMGTEVTVPQGSIGVFKYNGSWSNSVIDFLASVIGLKSLLGFFNSSAVYNTTGSGYVIPVTPGDSVYIKSRTDRIALYAFLQGMDAPYTTLDGVRYSISANDDETVSIPSGCAAIWIADSYVELGEGAYRPQSIKLNGNELLVSMLGNKHIIYGNAFIKETQVSSLADVLAAVPKNFRSELALLQWRDSTTKMHLNMFISQQPSVDATWNNVNYWKEISFSSSSMANLYPLYFNKDKENYMNLAQNLVLENDGDTFECEVTCGIDTLLNGGYAFSWNPVSEHHIGIAASYGRLAVRADDETWLLQSAVVNKFRYTFKIEFSETDILFYVDGELVGTYENSSGKKLTLSRFGVSDGYGYWNGTIHWIKVNGEMYNSNISKVSTDAPYSLNQLYTEKSTNTLTAYKKYSDNVYVGYPIVHASKSYTANQYPSFYDNWGLREPFLCYWNGTSMTLLNTLFRDGEAEMAVQAKDANGNSTYVCGSTHGFENIKTTDGLREISLIVDNSFVGETDTFTIKPSHSVCIRQYTELVPAYTNTGVFADVYKEWNIGNEVSISSSITMVANREIDRLMQGMFCVFRHISGNDSYQYLTNKAVKANKPYKVYDVSDDWEDDADNADLKTTDNSCNKIYEYGQTPVGFAMEIKDDNRDSSGGMFVATNNSTYNKIYYAARRGSATVTTGTEFHATQVWTII